MRLLIWAVTCKHPVRNLTLLAAPACMILAVKYVCAGLDDIARAINDAAGDES